MEYLADDLRIIRGTHTTVRRLEIVSHIIKTIGERQLPIEILKLQVEDWNRSVFNLYPEYRAVNGKLISKEGKLTSIFKHYLSLTQELGLIVKFGNVVSLTKLGNLLQILIKDKEELTYKINLKEKLFYLYLFLVKDADILLLILNQIENANNSINQKSIQLGFKEYLVERLEKKIKFSDTKTKFKLVERKRMIQVEWKKAEKYAEHFVTPRLEWLTQIGILNIKKKGSNTNYSFTGDGKDFLSNFLVDHDISLFDVCEKTIYNGLFTSIAKVFKNLELKAFSKISEEDQKKELTQKLLDAFSIFNTNNAMKVGYIPAYPYICIRLLSENGLVANFKDLSVHLDKSLVAGTRVFTNRHAARVNEGYILSKIDII